MTLTRSGIPTTYQQTAFRSRLEARWAAFFDLVGWSWVYEPFDATGWIPDFLIQGNAPLLIEVGPCVTLADYELKAVKPLRYLNMPTLIVGAAAVPYLREWQSAGWLVNEFPQSAGPAEWRSCEECDRWSVYGDGSCQLPCAHTASAADYAGQVDELWRRAGNEVQWKR